jgi:hypothetical protein
MKKATTVNNERYSERAAVEDEVQVEKESSRNMGTENAQSIMEETKETHHLQKRKKKKKRGLEDGAEGSEIMGSIVDEDQ